MANETNSQAMDKDDLMAYKALLNQYTREKDKSELLFDVRDGKKSKEDFKIALLKDCTQYFKNADSDAVVKAIIDNVLGYSVLTDIIYDVDVTDIKVHDWDHIIVKKNGKHMPADKIFPDESSYLRFIDGVITRNKVNASTQNAIQRFTDTKSMERIILRFTLVTDFLTSDKKPKLVIRKVPIDFMDMDDLVKKQVMPPEVKDYLKTCWKLGSVLVCGANASGKTTLLNALKEEIPADKSVLVIQQAEELTTKDHPDMLFLHSFEGVGENAVRYDLKDLSIAGLTLDIEYFIIGEVKGAEAAYLLNASYTGSICGATVHSNNSETALDKIVDYALYVSSYSKGELMNMLTGFKTIIFMSHFKIREISAVLGVENDKIIYEPLFRQGLGRYADDYEIRDRAKEAENKKSA